MRNNIRASQGHPLTNLYKNEKGVIEFSGIFDCSLMNGEYLEGKIVEIGTNAVRIEVDGRISIALISECTKVLCNADDGVLEIGD